MPLPEWLIHDKDRGIFVIDPDVAYTEWMSLLKIKPADLDQYWLEVIFQCVKMDAQHAVRQSGLDPRLADPPKSLVLDVASTKTVTDGKLIARWRLADYPRGRGPEAATQGKEARQHYQRVRGFLPQ